MTTFHPDLHPTARFIPRFSFSPWLVRLINVLARVRGVPKPPRLHDVDIEDAFVPGRAGAPAVRVRLYRPKNSRGPVPAMLWLHGGGFLFGNPEFDQHNNIAIVRELGIIVAAVDYRLAPQHPFPAPLEDAYAALTWLHTQAGTLGVTKDKIAVGGSSAGGGLAAALVLMATDRRHLPVRFQLLLYPMLDDRTVLRSDIDAASLRMWDTKSNRYGWSAYLGQEPGSPGVSPYAAPARRENLVGLPPAWLGTGGFDLFRDEDLAYAKRLSEAGVACEVQLVPGAYHGFDAISRNAPVSRNFRSSYVNALRRALF